MLAGAIGWSDNPPVLDGTALSETYTNFSNYGFVSIPSDSDMASAISSFMVGAIAIMDGSNALTRKNVTDGEMPIDAQILRVQWRYAGSILAVIPFIHFRTLMAVIVWANKAIIKDDTHLAIAKLYHTFLSQLGDGGCLLRGDEIVQALHNPQVAYGWRPSREHDGAMHVDVFEKGRDGLRAEGPFVEGWYDGSSKIRNNKSIKIGDGLGQRRRYRDVDAAEYVLRRFERRDWIIGIVVLHCSNRRTYVRRNFAI
ncbi:hypothetical protein A1O1_06562 [Capronia coronata CBS 617.96]|uniref:Uncharacterized protein n=1 Tax=Capronia coronata CBS 617.96 TaxID=1182541 RepID=W9Y045_9EURO|nr:uncharacterized protein A1O1_06562 [Capronia coronata CBS 617.96]EXJ86192.1 hypothetical protein A1O1_06562 [Capronia coronata CBS 617.96]